jgi:formylglycine-generating enzyme required for sulfatase activity
MMLSRGSLLTSDRFVVRRTFRVGLATGVCLLLATAAYLLWPQAAHAQARRHYAISDVLLSLRGGSTSRRIVSLLYAGCVDGDALGASAEASLRAASATDELIAAVRNMRCAIVERTPSAGSLGVGFGDDEFVQLGSGSFEVEVASVSGGVRTTRNVRVGEPFQLQRTEVTQSQWFGVMGTRPSQFVECDVRCPVDSVSWDDVQEFLRRLNSTNQGWRYRLPTEAEWEFAARANAAQTADGPEGSEIAEGWHRGNADFRTHVVATRQPNPWGLFDMLGNVREWVSDVYSSTAPYSATAENPNGETAGRFRVLRGGSWRDDRLQVGVSVRYYDDPAYAYFAYGFRLVRTR